MTAVSTSITAAPAVTHPLDRLTAEEIAAARAILDAAGLLNPTTRFAYLGLDEPAKSRGARLHRRHRVAPTAGSAPCCWTSRPASRRPWWCR